MPSGYLSSYPQGYLLRYLGQSLDTAIRSDFFYTLAVLFGGVLTIRALRFAIFKVPCVSEIPIS